MSYVSVYLQGCLNCLFHFHFRHQKFLAARSPLTMPLGPLTRYARTAVKTEFELTTEGLQVRESIPPNFISDSTPAEVSLLEEYR